jgi:NAD(P)-dependent dehydrogenase (short-subunit alcohol dehydrogenase family)
MWTLSLHLQVNFLRCSRLVEPSYQGTQGLLRITLRLSEPPSYVLYISVRTELTSSYPSDRIKRLYDINVHGAFFTAREAAKYMIPQGGGSIILVASMSANVRFMHF